MQKKSIGLKSEKKTLHVQHIFLYISLPLFCSTTSTYVKLPSCTFYGGNIVYRGVCSYVPFFFLLPLTLLAANICHFLIAALNFSCFCLPQWTSSPFFLFFVFFVFSSLQLFLCYRRQCSGIRGEQPNARSRDYQILSSLQVTIFSFARAQSFANTHSLLRKLVNY